MIIFSTIFQFLQSPKLASLISEHVNSRVLAREGLRVDFERVDLRIFPPTTYFKNVEIHKKDKDGVELFLKAKRIGFHFDLVDFFSSKFIISKISIWDALAKILIKTKSGEAFKLSLKILKEFKIKELQELYVEKIVTKLPFILRKLELDEIDVSLNDQDFLLDRLNFKLFKRSFRLEGRLEEFKFFKLTGWNPHEQELDFDINIIKDKIKIDRLDVKNKEDSIGFSGEIINGPLVTGDLSLTGRTENFSKNFGLLKGKDLVKGFIEAKISLAKDIFNPDAVIKVRVHDVVSKYGNVQRFLLGGEKRGNKLTIKKLTIQDKRAEIALRNDLVILDYKRIDPDKMKARFKLKNLPTKDALYYVKALKPIKGKINGELEVFIRDKDIFFKVLKGFRLDDFRLWFPGTKLPLLKNKGITANKGEVIVRDNGDVIVDFDFSFPNSRIIVAGEVLGKKESLIFKTKEGTTIDFKMLGPIAGVNIEGSGPTEIEVSGPSDNIVISLRPKLDNFNVLDFKLGKAEGEIDYIINQEKLDIKKLDSTFGNTVIKGKGNLTFGDSPTIDLSIEKPQATYQDSLRMYHVLVKDITLIPRDLDYDYATKFQIKGPLNLHKMAIVGQVKSGANSLYWEDINSSEFKFKFQYNKIKIFDLKILEGNGTLTGELEYDLRSSDIKYQAKINRIRTTDIEVIAKANLGFEGSFEGELSGVRKDNFFKSKMQLDIVKSTIGDVDVADSKIEVSIEGKKAYVRGDFLGQKITFESFLNFNKRETKNLSYLNFLVKSENIKDLLGFLSTHNMVDNKLEGEVELDFSSSFNLFDIKKLDAELNLKKLNLKKGEIKLSLDENARKISIKDGNINIWDVALKDEVNSLTFRGDGNFYNKFKIIAAHKMDVGIFKLFSPNLKIARGVSEGKMMFFGNKDGILTNIVLAGKLDKLSIYGVPNYFEDIDFNLSLENKDLLIQRFHGRYGKGELDLSGDITLNYPIPRVDLDYQFSNIRFPIMDLKKSYVLVSGRGSLDGNEIPYDLSGKYSIVYGDLRNEINEYYASVGPSTFYEKYLPKELIKRRFPYFNFDLGVNITTPIEMRNSLAEILFDGSIEVTGNSQGPIFNGVLRVVPNKSKVVFKANEFNIQVGEVRLNNAPVENPEIKFAGTAKIKEYDVKFEFEGATDNISIDFSSDPFLSKEDILSLLTIGITSEDAQGLSESEKQAITSVGLGTLLADQLKINQGLSSGLGLRLSVIPEVEEDTDYSGSEQREGVISPYATRYKSATSVQVKKLITKDLNLSISSRVGGSIDQKQRMSADYYINKNISLEGVYEIKTTQDANISNVSNAFGADLIFRWSFK